MVYLNNFIFPSESVEYQAILDEKRTCYSSFYPFQVLSKHNFERIDFESVTILYGGNGSGKSTALNVMAQTLGAQRKAAYNGAPFFKKYTTLCRFQFDKKPVGNLRILTSDDVFDGMINVRKINLDIDDEREKLLDEHRQFQQAQFQMTSMDDLSKLKALNAARRQTQSTYVKRRLPTNVRTYSNGESGFQYFKEQIQEGGLYLLDEPENSLSAERQIELRYFLEDAVRYWQCQFVIATHSPFILSMKGAKIYDLDEGRVDVKAWTDLKQIRVMYDFFKQQEEAFKQGSQLE